MTRSLLLLLPWLLTTWTPLLVAQDEPEESMCVVCHGESDMWEGPERRFYVTEKDLASDIHWARGLRCHDCHGGDPAEEDYASAHAADKGFRKMATPADVPGFCGRCHSDIAYMRRFQPSARTDQEAEFWTSGHGLRLKQDPKADVATCTSCHGRHDIRAVKDLESPVYPTRVAETCGTCHADATKMQGLTYQGRPLGHEQLARWSQSVHGRALMEDGDLAAPTCNDCHGNHGALPPEIGSVANACGSCHGRAAELFEGTRMKHRFEEIGLPGCSSCHGYHDIQHPDDGMLGMGSGAVCNRCHQGGQHGATLAGAEVARSMRTSLDELRARIADAEDYIGRAERLGMEVREPHFRLQEARTALTEARTLVHAFAPAPLEESVQHGLEVARDVRSQADAALEEHTARRIWLALSLILIGAVVVVLLVFIRRYPTTDA